MVPMAELRDTKYRSLIDSSNPSKVGNSIYLVAPLARNAHAPLS